MNTLYDKKALQKILGISSAKVDVMVRDKEISYVRVGRLVRFRVEDVFDYVQNNVVESVNECERYL